MQQKKILPYVLLIVATLALCIGWMVYRYQTETEPVISKVEKNGKMEEKTVMVKKFPINLGLDLKGGVHILLEAMPPKSGEPLTDDHVRGVIEVMENRLNPQGTKEVTIQKQGDRWVNIEIPGERDPEKVEKMIGGTAILEFLDTKGETWKEGEKIPPGAKVILTGEDFQEARADFDQYGKPCINFTFKKDAATIFGKFTARNVGKYLAIALDGTVISCPRIESAIFGGKGIITGTFSNEEVRDLAVKLNSGALPVDVQIVEKRSVGPTLGADSIRKSLNAGLAGVILVLIFMMAYYRLPGFLADMSLLCYSVIMMGFLSMFNATLTLPGVAGFILSIGMAVDANVIIFERLKEEIRIGKTLKAALDAGFTRAFTAILDSNVTTLIAAAVLYAFGTGPLRGFAVTLSLGILISMFSALIITRVFLAIAVNAPGMQSWSLYGASPANQIPTTAGRRAES